MNIKLRQSQLRTLRPGDPKFRIDDGFVSAPRAGFEISQSCPTEYKNILITALNAGWLKPVATVTEKELIFIGLGGNNGSI